MIGYFHICNAESFLWQGKSVNLGGFVDHNLGNEKDSISTTLKKIFSSINGKIEELYLQKNSITSAQLPEILSIVHRNPQYLRKINLWFNQIGDEGFLSILRKTKTYSKKKQEFRFWLTS